MTNPVVFIVGCPRSGTTLLRNIVSEHPSIVITPEAHWIPLWYENRKGITSEGLVTPTLISELLDHPKFALFHLHNEEVIKLVPDGEQMTYASFLTSLFDLYGRIRGKNLVGNKTPDSVRKINTLHSLWPNARFVHLIRDGRDVALSMMNWSKVSSKKPGTFPTWTSDPVSTAALWWELNVRAGLNTGRSLGSALYCEMRYESLISDPENECRRLCEFLHLPYDSSMLHYYHKRPAKYNSDPNQKPEWQPITQGLRDWRKQMNPKDVERFEAAAGGLLDELGYQRAFSQLGSTSQQHATTIRTILTQEFTSLY